MILTPFSLLRWLGWTTAALIAAAAVQLAANADVYNAAFGLYPRFGHSVFWICAGLLMATVFRWLYSRASRALRPDIASLAISIGAGFAILLDPYLLGTIGWRFAAAHADSFRTLQLLFLAGPLIHNVQPRALMITGYVLIGAIGILLPRYWLVPLLPATLEQGALAPVHLLVLGRDLLLWLLLMLPLRAVWTRLWPIPR